MKVELFCLCDFASTDAAGKLNIIGVFDTIRTSSAPITQNLLAVAGKIRFEPAEVGAKRFKLSFYDPDRKNVIGPVEAEIEITSTLEESLPNAQIALLFSEIRLPNFGKYSIELEVEGKHVASTALYVLQLLSH